MIFNTHEHLEGTHAPFGPSRPAWLRYDDEKAIATYKNMTAIQLGTKLHEWAKETIDLKIRQPRTKRTLSSYVNDAIGFDMNTEVLLYYSPYFYGTADAISFKRNLLRIHDLKTGATKVNMEQLLIYAALFCLEYKIKPADIDMECRVYQNDDILVANPTEEDIIPIMDKIIHINKLLDNNEGGSSYNGFK